MTSLTQALSVALSGLQTTTGLISVASDNISNANTPGYSNKTANVASLDFGAEGGGSTITSYTRTTDPTLTNNYNAATSTASYTGTLNSYMTQVQAILDSTASNPTLTSDISNFASAWTQYSAQPESSIQQQNVINAGKQLASDIQTIAANVGTLNTQVQSDTSTTVTSLNSALKHIASLNSQIQLATTSGQNATDLQDQRDTAINQLSTYLSVTSESRSNGEIAVYTTGGQLLVDGPTSTSFSYDGTNVKDQTGAPVNGSLTGGSLQAELDFRDPNQVTSTSPGVATIPKMQSQLSAIVAAFVNQPGGSTSLFANAYSNAASASTATTATQHGDTVDNNFFQASFNAGVANSSSFVVNPDLLNGTSQIPQTGTQAIAGTFTTTANYTASGLTANGVTYTQLGAQVLSGFQQSANILSTQNTTNASQQSYYKTTLASTTGVNVDTQLANLVIYQNSYAASAHVITTVNNMLSTLISSIG